MFDEIVTKEGLKFNDLEKKIYKFVCMLGCFIIKSILESRDRKLMKARDTKKFRHKGYKNNCIKTIMGEVEYKRHSLVNKSYIAGMMSSKKLEKIRNARLYQKYDLDKVKLRVMNGDGARWIKNITAKDAISQKDNFHIHQEIVRDIQDKKYREELEKIIEEKRFDEVEKYIENLKSELGGEEKTVKKLKTLQSYLKDGLPRYQDVLKERNQEMPKAPEGIEYRNPGIMESQIFTVLKVRLGSGRKSFCKQGASYLAKVCALKVEEKNQISLEKVEEPIKIDNSVEEWINAIEENIKNNKQHRANRKETEEKIGATKNVLINARFMKEIMKERSFSQMGYII